MDDAKFKDFLEADAHNWDTRELADKKLSEEIAGTIYLEKHRSAGIINLKLFKDAPPYERGDDLKVADQILALIKQAGWTPPEDNASIYQTLATMHKWAKAAGYVKLADDQTLPQSISNEFLGEIVVMGVEAMKKEWRKVVLKEE